MSMIDITSLAAAATITQPAAQAQRAVSDAAARQFREALTKTDCVGDACAAQQTDRSSMLSVLDIDFEKLVMSHMPSPTASPAEFAVGLLRAQVEVGTVSVAIEMASNTTHSLQQGVQTLTSR
jgi:hypothetical protein